MAKKDNKEKLSQALELLKSMEEDSTIPKNVKMKVKEMISDLERENGDLSLKINKILSDIEELSSDINIPMFVRTQLWQLTSILESIQA